MRQPSTAEDCEKMGSAPSLVGAPDANILREVIELLRQRTTAGAALYLIKVKAHQGEPANEEANNEAYKANSSKNVLMEWCDRTNRAIFTETASHTSVCQVSVFWRLGTPLKHPHVGVFWRLGATGQMKQFLYGNSLAGKKVR